MKARFVTPILILASACLRLYAQPLTHPHHVIDAGGGVSASASSLLRTSFGQSAVEAGTANGFTLEGGFIPVIRGGMLPTSTMTVGVPVATGWNIVSLPMSSPVPDDSVRSIFQNSINPYAFAFDNGYTQRYTMQNGPGYWIKSSTSYTQNITGTPRDTLTISVNNGWRVIGSISTSIDTSAAHVTSSPAGLRASNFFRYSNGYVVASTIEPGEGYWVKVNGTGSFSLHAAGPIVTDTEKHKPKRTVDDLNTLSIRDAGGGSQTLYFGADATGQLPVSMYVMPPLPPAGSFDARFESRDGGTMVQTHPHEITGAMELPIAIRSRAYPLMISWSIRTTEIVYTLTDAMGGVHTLRGNGGFQIQAPATTNDVNRVTLEVESSARELPTNFSLHQNYPNPFNPSTTIRYDLPSDARVTMKIFNVIGQEVATLASEEQKAGYKSVVWNASDVASGVYFYKVVAASGGLVFNDVRKMLVVK